MSLAAKIFKLYYPAIQQQIIHPNIGTCLEETLVTFDLIARVNSSPRDAQGQPEAIQPSENVV